MSDIKVYGWLDLNRGPLASEATALPTEPRPPPLSLILSLNVVIVVGVGVVVDGSAVVDFCQIITPPGFQQDRVDKLPSVSLLHDEFYGYTTPTLILSSSPVWPDLASFRHFCNIFKGFWQFLIIHLFSIWQNIEPFFGNILCHWA